MADNASTEKSLAMPPLQLDATPSIRRSLEKSPSQSSVSSTRAYTLCSSVPSTPVIPTRPPSPEKKPLHPGDCSAFLTTLAAQERRVLELKEEVQKAEGELEKLKKQWATHEATKKRNELRHLEQLQPLKTSLGGSDLVTSRDNDVKITGRDLDRRKMAPPMVKPSRTVFSGSKHTRALSLLSPKDSLAAGSHLPSPSHVSPIRHRFSTNGDAIPNNTQESSNSTDGPSDSDGLYRAPPKDMILETGKQLVGDFRHGLWTFFEDLRQVTVGDEAISTSDLRNQHSMLAGNMLKTQAKRVRVLGVRRVPDGGAGFWPSHLATSQLTNPLDTKERNTISAGTEMSADVGPLWLPAAHTHTSNAKSNSSASDDDDGWDSWDTVTTKSLTTQSKKASSAADLLSSPLTNKSSPRTSTTSTDARSTPRPNKPVNFSEDRDDIPCPALTKLSSGRFSKTASTLMSEWKKSLAPPSTEADTKSLDLALTERAPMSWGAGMSVTPETTPK